MTDPNGVKFFDIDLLCPPELCIRFAELATEGEALVAKVDEWLYKLSTLEKETERISDAVSGALHAIEASTGQKFDGDVFDGMRHFIDVVSGDDRVRNLALSLPDLVAQIETTAEYPMPEKPITKEEEEVRR